MVILNNKQIGKLRRLFMIEGTHSWNMWVRDVTACLG